jgi:hypothetical protein
MPRYFFDTHNGETVLDHRGLEFPNFRAAREDRRHSDGHDQGDRIEAHHQQLQRLPAQVRADGRRELGRVGYRAGGEHVIAQKPQPLEVSIEAVQDSAGAAVDFQRSLLDRQARQVRRGAEHHRRDRFVLTEDGDAGK